MIGERLMEEERQESLFDFKGHWRHETSNPGLSL